MIYFYKQTIILKNIWRLSLTIARQGTVVVLHAATGPVVLQKVEDASTFPATSCNMEMLDEAIFLAICNAVALQVERKTQIRCMKNTSPLHENASPLHEKRKPIAL